MKSKNHLSITGTVLHPRVDMNNNRAYFTLIHNYGGDKKPLFLACVIRGPMLRSLISSLAAEHEDVRIDAALSINGTRIEANVYNITNQ